MKKTFKRTLSLLICLVMIRGAAGCRKKDPAVESGEKDGILTNVYDRVSGADGGGTLNSNVRPYWDGEKNTLTYLASRIEEAPVPGEEEITVQYAAYVLVTLAEDGTAEESVILDDREGYRPGCGWIDADGITCTVYAEDGGNPRGYLSRYEKEGDTWVFGTDLLALFRERPYSLAGLREDGNGDLYAASDREILILSPDGKPIRSVVPQIPSGGQISGLCVSPDGRIWADFSYLNGSPEAAEIFKTDGTVGERFPHNGGLRDGDGSYLFFCTGNNGVYGYAAENGTIGKKLLLDYVNSGILWSEAIFFASAGGRMFFWEYGGIGNYADGCVTIYAPGEDIDLTQTDTLTVAYFGFLTTSMTAAVNDFNREHPGTRVVLDDWSQYNTDENWHGGYEKLTRDMTTGLYKPDILVGGAEALPLRTAREKSLYTDLTPLLAEDDTVNPDNLFGCVKRFFDDGRGGMWGIASNFTLRTLISTPAILGKYAEQGYWMLEDVLDVIDSLPDGAEFMPGLTRDIPPLIGMGGYMEFVDPETGTCSFDSPVFIRYLNYADSLPSNEEYEASSPYAGKNAEELAEPRINGKIVASVGSNNGNLGSVDRIRRLLLEFSTKDWTMIGYPAPEARAGAGTVVSAQNVCVVTSFCENPELAWDLIRRSFTSEEGQGGLPSLIPLFDDALKEQIGFGQWADWYDLQFEDYYILHDTNRRTHTKDDRITEDDMLYPGVLTDFTREDRDRYVKFLDEAGVSPEHAPVQEIMDILYEEMFAFLGGIGTAEDCAAKIQSRVEIWLAEHK